MLDTETLGKLVAMNNQLNSIISQLQNLINGYIPVIREKPTQADRMKYNSIPQALPKFRDEEVK